MGYPYRKGSEEEADCYCDEHMLPQMPQCPVCRGDGFYLGALGSAEWFACRYCGWQFAVRDSLP